MPFLAMAYNGVFFAYCLYFARKHQVYDYRSYNDAFYGKYAPIFSNLFEVLYLRCYLYVLLSVFWQCMCRISSQEPEKSVRRYR